MIRRALFFGVAAAAGMLVLLALTKVPGVGPYVGKLVNG